MKTCTKCKVEKEKTEFKKSKRAKDGLDSWCKKCTYALRSARYEHYRKVERTRELKKKYDMTLEQYEEMKLAQNYKCAICEKHESEVYRGKLFIDHCHKSGKVRQLLCDKCNVGLRSFGDKPELLEKAIAYLIRHRS